MLFLYAPSGRLNVDQRQNLERSRSLDGALLVVCATASRSRVPPRISRVADAVVWKGLRGYDFSAYAIALAGIAKLSPGARVLLQNDSVFGPFGDVDTLVARAPWEITGITASGVIENHLQSYALIFQSVTQTLLSRLWSVLPQHRCLDAFQDVVLLQETRLGRVASRRTTVGALFAPVLPSYATNQLDQYDPTLSRAIDLIDLGSPYVKKSILGKHSGFQDSAAIRRRLRAEGWRVPRDPSRR